ncbi:MAG: KpsF/GutQ family sugar-phosphate isomerase [Natronospirillum sp.]|uniref:KpsF/GutQ family sugar-phosphate isomerase n=1 Tax=Natronospirillum sp. TaxID=2812955 RepID=UPI0025FBEF98|nr:KpsF/GutQ family sugar-phosphate isomerase [Natronospirillum sp.]MCH8552254.1 KpsF/GutQ family sugar-phosphate isomerase [Natronospirillum sp.]
MTRQTFDYLAAARRTLTMEAEALLALTERLDEHFIKACDLILANQGRVVVTGMGKSGHIGNKIAATLASTGTPSFFMHPGEASHGDLGMITRQDLIVALSNSGETREIIDLLPAIKRLGIPVVAITGQIESTLGQEADATLDSGVDVEACPLNLAPTSSTTTALVLGDALAIALLEARGFSAEDFAFSHPGGSLGKRLLLKVGDIMQGESRVPSVPLTASLQEALLEMTRKGLGMTTILDDDRHLLGVYTDGDLRRTFERQLDVNKTGIRDVMHPGGKTIHSGALAAEALYHMEQAQITSLVVVDASDRVAGVVHMHDLLRAGVA